MRAVMEKLGADARAGFAQGVREEWVEELCFVEWILALWEDPCRQDSDALRAFVDRLTERGFGRARRVMLSLASPWVILRRAHALWRAEHTHGSITVARFGPTSARLQLTDHPYTENPVSRAAISEAFRYVVLSCRVAWATESHRKTGSALHVDLQWG